MTIHDRPDEGDLARREFLRTVARGAVWVAPAIVTLAAPRGLHARQVPRSQKMGGMSMGDGGGAGGKGMALVVEPPGGLTGTVAPWERKPGGGS